MPATYEPIATTTLGGTAPTVTFSSIPATYTDLILVMQLKITTAGAFYMQLNGDTATNYSQTYLYGDGTSAASGRRTSQTNMRLSNGLNPENNFNFNEIVQLQNYSNTTTFKSVLTRANNAAGGTEAAVMLWRSTAAINSILVSTFANNFDTGSTFTLYGIKAA